MTLKEMSAMLDVPFNTYRMWESDQYMPTLQRLACFVDQLPELGHMSMSQLSCFVEGRGDISSIRHIGAVHRLDGVI